MRNRTVKFCLARGVTITKTAHLSCHSKSYQKKTGREAQEIRKEFYKYFKTTGKVPWQYSYCVSLIILIIIKIIIKNLYLYLLLYFGLFLGSRMSCKNLVIFLNANHVGLQTSTVLDPVPDVALTYLTRDRNVAIRESFFFL